MKKVMFTAFAVGLGLTASVMAQVKIGKITKVENIVAKDDYGNVKEKFIKIKFTLDNGQTSIVEHQNPMGLDDNSSIANATWNFQGINKSKNMYIWTVECPRCGLYKVEIRAYEFIFDSKSKKYSAKRIKFHSEKNIDGAGIGGDTMFDSGWSFNRLENDRIIMTKDGVEYVLKTANKSSGGRYLTFE